MALSGESLDDLVKPDMRREWEDVKDDWFPRTDTAENEAYDKRTPGKCSIIIKLRATNSY